VHGTDVITGNPVMLAVEEAEATHAVQAALSKRIVVSHVTREGVRRALFPLACAGVVVLGGLCAWLIQREGTARTQLAAVREDLLTMRLEAAKPVVPVVVGPTVDQQIERRMGDAKAALSVLTNRLALTEGQKAQIEAEQTHLKADHEKMLAALAAKGRAAQAEHDKADAATARAARAENDLGSLTQTNKQLSGELDTLKAQLLASAAKPVAETRVPESGTADGASQAAPLRWALKASYDTASDFVAMHFEKDSMQTEPLADGTVAWSATSGANAATVRVTHDREKRRVYAATLTVSLAADAPKEKLDENRGLIVAFLQDFAAGNGDAAKVNRMIQQLAGKDGSERCVLVGGDTRVTVWNNGAGLYSWRAESVGNSDF
jgi:hypothetical protein